MSTEEKILKLVEGLLAKTKSGDVVWERTSSPDVFQAAFPSYTVRVSTRRSENQLEALDYVVSILDEAGTTIERASDVDLTKALGGVSAYQLMQELYALARRQALGVDGALDTLLSELSR